jgi:hypothetical protein
MKATRFARFETEKWLDGAPDALLEGGFYDYSGPVDLACGATGTQEEQLATAQNLSSEMNVDFGTIFGQNQAILSNITSALEPVVAAGPGQYGYSAAEDAAMRSQATENIAQAGRAATDTTRSAMAAEGGGNIYLPSGSQEAVEAGLAAQTAEKQAEAQSAITQAGYQTGRQNFFQAEGMLAGAPAGLEEPATGYAKTALSALSGAEAQEDKVAAANAAPGQMIGGLLGSVAGAFLGPVGAALGSKVGGLIGGSASGGGGGSTDSDVPNI